MSLRLLHAAPVVAHCWRASRALWRWDRHEARTVVLSSILKWYKSELLAWYETTQPNRAPTLLTYAALYAPGRADELQRAAAHTIRFVPYDWRLNDQHGPT